MKVLVRAVKRFTDRDGNKVRTPEEEFEVTEERLSVLSSSPKGPFVEVISEVEESEEDEQSEETKKTDPEEEKEADEEELDFPVHAGGAYYKLSNGKKVKGKEAAIEAEKEL